MNASELAITSVAGVDIGYWDPPRRVSTWGRPARRARRVRNFGDLLGPVIVRTLVKELGLETAADRRRLLAIGSILHFAEPDDVVWGPGLNTKAGTELSALPRLDVRAVRGPRTRLLLRERFGVDAPTVFGDPGLLLGALQPELLVADEHRRGVAVVPNLNELAGLSSRAGVVNPRSPIRRVVARIAASELVVGSSLHGIIVAESLGVPARAVRTGAEGDFKYEDYYRSTGRDPSDVLADTVEEAIARGGAEPPRWDPQPLLRAFPTDLWSGTPRLDRLEALADRIERGRMLHEKKESAI